MHSNSISIGRKQDLALYLAFEEDPDNGLGATEEESVSWGLIEVWVRGKNLCEHLEGSEVVSSVHWYLLPLIEWLTANWDPLLHEERLPNLNAGVDAWNSLHETRFLPGILSEDAADEWFAQWQRWWSRHGLQSCQCGGLFPDIVIRRWQDMVEISWGNVRLPGIPEDVMFNHAQGFERFDPRLVAERLYDLLQQSIRYLIGRLPSSQCFQRLEQDVSSIKHTPRYNRIAWLAGLDSLAEAVIAKWHKVATALRSVSPPEVAAYLLENDDDDLVVEGSCHAALMFGSASPTLNEDDVSSLAHKLIELYACDAENPDLINLVSLEPISANIKIWENGYSLAEKVIEHFSLDNQTIDFVDLDAILDRLGIRQEETELSDETIRGVSVAGPRHQPAILVNKRDRHNADSAGKRFTLAHELCHILFDRTSGKKLAMVSGPWAPLQVEQRAKAFAAMLLMPPEALRRVVAGLSGPIESEQDIHEIRCKLGTSFMATLEHLRNLQWLDPASAERIAAERDARFGQDCTMLPSLADSSQDGVT